MKEKRRRKGKTDGLERKSFLMQIRIRSRLKFDQMDIEKLNVEMKKWFCHELIKSYSVSLNWARNLTKQNKNPCIFVRSAGTKSLKS